MKSWKRLISMLLTAAMLFALAVPSVSAADSADDSKPHVAWEKVEDAPRIVNARKVETIEQTPVYTDSDLVRVSIVLEDASTLEAGFSTVNIAENAAALRYREDLAAKQDQLASRISSSVLKGKALDVVWNLTLAANIISANVEYGQIDAIKAVKGVADVFVETRYEPDVVSRDTYDPNMATGTEMVNATLAWASGYTGAGSKIAIVDTGLDIDHQSFDAGAFDYAIAEVEADGKTVELMTKADVEAVWDQLNISSDEFVASATADDAYVSSKVPFAMNYVDANTDATHLNDTQGEHGSHVASIAAANRYIPDGNGGYTAALESVLTQGEAPDAQLVIMKVFGKGGGAYDSDYFAAIEDAIVLGCDSVNLSLGSGNPGLTTNSTYADLLDSLAEANIVWTNSSGNAYHWANSTYSGYLYAWDASFAMTGSGPRSSTTTPSAR